ncbi:MAG: hypothetical protein U9Q99_02500 [Nanoarchaeota archaeon]|nr:hypothetical protein [Nanoarchaeota archaeon]
MKTFMLTIILVVAIGMNLFSQITIPSTDKEKIDLVFSWLEEDLQSSIENFIPGLQESKDYLFLINGDGGNFPVCSQAFRIYLNQNSLESIKVVEWNSEALAFGAKDAFYIDKDFVSFTIYEYDWNFVKDSDFLGEYDEYFNKKWEELNKKFFHQLKNLK